MRNRYLKSVYQHLTPGFLRDVKFNSMVKYGGTPYIEKGRSGEK